MKALDLGAYGIIVPLVNTPQEALLVTLNERGCVDLDYLAGLLHRVEG